MNKKPMGKKTGAIVLAIIIVAAIFLGLILVNKGDGPVNGMILADRPMVDTGAYSAAAADHGDGIYLVVSNAFNKFQEDYKADIPEGQSLYGTISFVECPKGSEYTGKWIKDGNVIAEEKGILPTGPKGVISYMLGGESVTKGSYAFELYAGDSKIFDHSFSVG